MVDNDVTMKFMIVQNAKKETFFQCYQYRFTFSQRHSFYVDAKQEKVNEAI